MALTETVAPATTQLTQVDTVKTELEISGSAEDGFLGTLVDQASNAIVQLTGRPYGQATYQETVRGYGNTNLMLSRTPVASISSITQSGATITGWTIASPDAGILYRKDGWTWTARGVWNLIEQPFPNSEEALFTVTYVAGYKLPNDVGRDLPESIERVCIDAVKAGYLNRGTDPSIKSQKVGDLAVAYGTSAAAIAATVREHPLLQPWRRAA